MNMNMNSVDSLQASDLESRLREYNESYRLGYPLIPDHKFDELKKDLEELDPNNSFLKEVGLPTERNKEILPVTMGSLKNKTTEDIHDWLEKHTGSGFVMSHKLDGVSILVQYRNFKLSKAWLRGDGTTGEVITKKAWRFVNPHQIQDMRFARGDILLRGEVLLNCDPKELGYKNKRNSVAGILHRKDDKHLEHLKIMFHGWLNPTDDAISNEVIRLETLRPAVRTVPFIVFGSESGPKNIIEAAIEFLEEKTDYDKDGIVITTINSEVENVKLPEEKIAFKINKMESESIIQFVEWNTSRTGKIIPLAYINPVELGGALIGKCTAFNAKFVKEKKLGIASKIIVVRSGDVIPYIAKSDPSDLTVLPDQCPDCETDLVWGMNNTHLECPNVTGCPSQVQARIAHFFITLGLEFFSEKMLASLDCKKVVDVYKLTEDDIMKIPGWGEKSSKDFVRRIQDTKTTTPQKLLAALGIEGLGKSISKLLLENVEFNDLIGGRLSTISLTNIRGIGPKKADAIVSGIDENMEFINSLMLAGIEIKKESSNGGPLKGLSFCITGKMSKPRLEFMKVIESLGGENASISKATYLICNEPSESGKNKEAAKQNVPIITETEFFEIVEKRR